MATFGEMLRAFRQASNDPERLNRRLSQERLGELIGNVMDDAGVTGAAVSYWERGETKINADDRNVLLALVKVLHRCGGIKTLTQANYFLGSGNYRPLDVDEAGKIFTGIPTVLTPSQETSSNSSAAILKENFFAVAEREFKALVAKAKAEGPDPWWPRVLAALMRKATDGFSISLSMIMWVWVWLIAWWLIAPSLRLSFSNQNEMLLAMQKYVIGSLIIPLIMGLLINTKDSEYWRQQSSVTPWLLRLYTYQGAGIGFNLGYFFVLPFSFLLNYLHLEPSVWVGVLAATAGLILGNMGARVVPHNLWRVFGRLTWADGALFFVVALMGPLWSFFFLEFYTILLDPVIGVLVFLLAITGMVFSAARKSKHHDK